MCSCLAASLNALAEGWAARRSSSSVYARSTRAWVRQRRDGGFIVGVDCPECLWVVVSYLTARRGFAGGQGALRQVGGCWCVKLGQAASARQTGRSAAHLLGGVLLFEPSDGCETRLWVPPHTPASFSTTARLGFAFRQLHLCRGALRTQCRSRQRRPCARQQTGGNRNGRANAADTANSG